MLYQFLGFFIGLRKFKWSDVLERSFENMLRRVDSHPLSHRVHAIRLRKSDAAVGSQLRKVEKCSCNLSRMPWVPVTLVMLLAAFRTRLKTSIIPEKNYLIFRLLAYCCRHFITSRAALTVILEMEVFGFQSFSWWVGFSFCFKTSIAGVFSCIR